MHAIRTALLYFDINRFIHILPANEETLNLHQEINDICPTNIISPQQHKHTRGMVCRINSTRYISYLVWLFLFCFVLFLFFFGVVCLVSGMMLSILDKYIVTKNVEPQLVSDVSDMWWGLHPNEIYVIRELFQNNMIVVFITMNLHRKSDLERCTGIYDKVAVLDWIKRWTFSEELIACDRTEKGRGAKRWNLMSFCPYFGLSSPYMYSISKKICTRFLLCCALLWLYIDWFSHIHQAYFTGTVAI